MRLCIDFAFDELIMGFMLIIRNKGAKYSLINLENVQTLRRTQIYTGPKHSDGLRHLILATVWDVLCCIFVSL